VAAQTVSQFNAETAVTINNRQEPETRARADGLRRSVRQYIAAGVSDPDGVLGNLDRWSQRRVAAENIGKIDLMLESEDPVEHCFQNLIREIDSEAEMGVLLVNPSTAHQSLNSICEVRGVSGHLHKEIQRIAPVVFPDEYAHSQGDLDLVWVTVQALYDRASFDASTSEFAIGHFFDNADNVADMVRLIRSLFYPFYEEGIRRQFDLPSLLDEAETQDLFAMVSDLMLRAGSYENRISMIESRADKRDCLA
jgi:hypothetical protein